jgi:hypothetical protein
MRQMKLRKFINQRSISLLLLALSLSREALAAQLQLSWVDNSANEDGFKIDRMSGTSGAFVAIATVGANVTSYTDPNLSDGTNYCYRVKAFNSAGESPSVEACKATEILATFSLSITRSGNGSGTVTSNPIAVNCGISCNTMLTTGTTVSLVATPAAGSTFTGWSGHADCIDGSVTMNTNKSCIATFNKPTVDLRAEWLHASAELLTNRTKYADINGDGKIDAVYFDTAGSRGIWVSLGTEDGFAPAEMWLQHGDSTPDQIQYADVNGDGTADALYFDTLRSRGVWVSLSEGVGFKPAEMWVQYGESTPNQVQYADINGDGKADGLYFDSGKSNCIRVSFSTGIGFTSPQSWICHGPSTPDQIQYADVNGDGKADALYFDTLRSRGVWVSLSTGTGFTSGQKWLEHGESTPEQIYYSDLNGDGKADAIYYDVLRSGGVWVSLSNGNSFATAFLWSID